MRVRGGPPQGYSKQFPAISLPTFTNAGGGTIQVTWNWGNLAGVGSLTIETSDNGAGFVLQSARTVAQIKIGGYITPAFTSGHTIAFRIRVLDTLGSILDDIQPLPNYVVP
jgi:hypothetical protein